jgi:hypothetical protein
MGRRHVIKAASDLDDIDLQWAEHRVGHFRISRDKGDLTSASFVGAVKPHLAS